MNTTWIKLFRKLIYHDVFNDESAFRVFMWILMSVDYNTGKMISGRFWASERLNIKATTYYKILKRLEKKYDLVTLSSNNKNTVVLVKNWSRYQGDSNTSSDNKVTTKGQQSNTTQEVKNKEIKNIYASLKCLTNDLCKEIAIQYSVNEYSVRKLRDDLKGWCEAKGKTYKNYKSALQNWVRKEINKGSIKKEEKSSLPTVDDISEEQRLKNMEMIKEMKSRLLR